MPIYKGANQITKVYQGEQEIDKVYRGASKVYGADKGTEITVSGNPLVLTNVAKEKALDTLEINGRTEQTQLQGYNLWQQNWLRTSTQNGVTLTNNGDGTYTLNGTCTTSINFQQDIELKAGTYVLKANSNLAINSSTYLVQVYSHALATGNGVFNRDGVNGYVTFTFNSDTSAVARIRVQEGITYDNLIVKPQLEVGSVAHSYEPYCGGIPSPNPAYPQEIVNVNSLEVVQSGKNWLKNIPAYSTNRIKPFDINAFTLLKKGKYTLSVADVVGATTWRFAISVYDVNGIGLSTIEKFTLLNTAGSNDAYFNQTGYCLESSNRSNKKWTVIVNEDVYIYLHFTLGDSNSSSIFKDVQIEQGTEATPYEPYKPIHIATIDGIELTQVDKIVKRNGVWGIAKWSKTKRILSSDIAYISASYNNSERSAILLSKSTCFPLLDNNFSEKNRFSYCNMLTKSVSSSLWSNMSQKNMYCLQVNNSWGGCIALDNELIGLTDYTNTSAIRTAYSNFFDNNNVVIVGQMPTEQAFIPLSQTIQDQLNALQIVKPTTVVTNNAECEMSATYLCLLDSAEAMLTNLYIDDLKEVLQ